MRTGVTGCAEERKGFAKEDISKVLARRELLPARICPMEIKAIRNVVQHSVLAIITWWIRSQVLFQAA
jgi:hypothetical protein